MIRHVVLAAAALAIGVTGVVAQGDPISTRKELMKGVGGQSRVAREMVEGKRPFDVNAAKKVLATYADAGQKLPGLFPDNSKTGGETKALPAIWEKKADFNALAAKFSKEAQEAEAKVKDLDSFKAVMGEVGKNCGACHNTYRAKS
jgi:cytochrome c556